MTESLTSSTGVEDVSWTPAPVWFLDTSALISVAISPNLNKQIMDDIGSDPVILLQEVVDELRFIAGRPLRVAAHAARALRQLDLQGTPRFGAPIDGLALVARKDVLRIQRQLSDPRSLRHDNEHLAESVAIEIMRTFWRAGFETEFLFLIEDHAARVAAWNAVDTCFPWSTPRLLWERVHAPHHPLTEDEAEANVRELVEAERCGSISAAEFKSTTPHRLGRVGEP